MSGLGGDKTGTLSLKRMSQLSIPLFLGVEEAPIAPVQPARASAPGQASPIPTAPPRIIPQDPAQAIEAMNGMKGLLSEELGKEDTITFFVSWPDDDSSYLASVDAALSLGCRTQPRQCWFAQPRNPKDLDYPQVKGSRRPGLTIHGKDAEALARILGRWFTTFNTSHIPRELDVYKYPGTKDLIWVEIGPGSPWKTAE